MTADAFAMIAARKTSRGCTREEFTIPRVITMGFCGRARCCASSATIQNDSTALGCFVPRRRLSHAAVSQGRGIGYSSAWPGRRAVNTSGLVKRRSHQGRQVVNAGRGADADVSMGWSSDSRWLLAKASGGTLDLIDVTTGMILPLGVTAGYGPGDLK